MTPRRSILLTCVLAAAAATAGGSTALARRQAAVSRISWADTAPVRSRLEAAGITADSFETYVARTHDENLRRVHEGDLDHLVFYLLQSLRITTAAPIEPAVSAKSLVDGLSARERDEFLNSSTAAASHVPPAVRTRIQSLVRAFERPGDDARLLYFRSLIAETVPARADREAALTREYLRAMRFVYEKEFVAQRADRRADAVADLYRTRGLSTDTAVEAGYVVQLGLAVLKGLEPARRIRRVLIVGPGMDLAPRTGFRETPPESYQPWAVIDALLATGLSRVDDLEVTAADINPRVVEHLARARRSPPVLSLVTDIAEAAGVVFSPDYREYFAQLGNRVSAVPLEPAREDEGRHLRKSVRVSPATADTLRPEGLDIVTERLTVAPFDLVIATNILPYFDDRQLALAAANIAAMMAPRGVFLHNEPRPILGDLTTALGVPFEQSRHVVIATVAGAPAPLGDSIFIHVKR